MNTDSFLSSLSLTAVATGVLLVLVLVMLSFWLIKNPKHKLPFFVAIITAVGATTAITVGSTLYRQSAAVSVQSHEVSQ